MIDISDIYNNNRTAVFIRHAERFPIPKGQLGDDVILNSNGKNQAIQLGENLQNFTINKIYTSPVLRCVQTAEKICEGFKNEIEIIESEFLGNPSAYIKDANLASKVFKQKSIFESLENYFAGNSIPGFYSLTEGSKRLDDFLQKSTSDKGLTLFISHDSIIIFYIFYKTGQKFSRENPLNYLDGIKLIFND